MSASTAFFTIASKNYLAHVRTLMESVAKHHPEAQRFLVLADTPGAEFDPATEPYTIVLTSEFPLPRNRWFHFKYTLVELNTAVKPFAAAHLASRYPTERLVYLDPDIYLYRPLDEILTWLESYDVVLTPHLLAPIDDGWCPTELDILRAGSYNLGFLALAINDNTRRLVRWWQDKLALYSYDDRSRGLFTDQKWMDLVPGIFERVHVLRDPGCNAAYWNLPERRVVREGDNYTAGGRPLTFFHFSGLDPANPAPLSRHQNRLTLDETGDAKQLVLDYVGRLNVNGYAECSQWSYGYGRFANGEPVFDMARRYGDSVPGEMDAIADPFGEEGHRRYTAYWNEFVASQSGRRTLVTRLAQEVYRRDPGLPLRFPDVFGEDALDYAEWLVTTGREEHRIPQVFLDPLLDELLRLRRAGSETAQRRLLAEREALLAPLVSELPPPVARLLDAERGELCGFSADQLLQPGFMISWLNEPVYVLDHFAGTRLAGLIYRARRDLQLAFPEYRHGSAERYLSWLVHRGAGEYRIGGELLMGLRRALATARAHRGEVSRFRSWARLTTESLLASARMLLGVEPEIASSPALPVDHAPRAGLKAVAGLKADEPSREIDTGGINIAGYLRSEMGVGESARAMAAAARSAGIPVSLVDFRVNDRSRLLDTSAGPIDNLFRHGVNVFHVNADQTQVLFSWLQEAEYGGRYNIGFWAWELSEFPDQFLDSFAWHDEIWTPSSFCQDAIARRSPVPVVRIPHAVEVEPVEGLSRAALGLPEHELLFLVVFDALSVFARKNPQGAVAAFRAAAGRMPGARLILKVNNADQCPDKMDELRRLSEGLPVTLIDRVFTRREINALISHADCLVSLHRSEGFGLPLAEAMWCGVPVIATAYSGNMDFTRHDTALLVSYSLTKVGGGAFPYPADAELAEPDTDAAIEAMLAVYSNGELRRRIAASGQRFVRRHFSRDAVGAMIGRRLEEIRRAGRRRR